MLTILVFKSNRSFGTKSCQRSGTPGFFPGYLTEEVKTGSQGVRQCPRFTPVDEDREHKLPEDLDLDPAGQV